MSKRTTRVIFCVAFFVRLSATKRRVFIRELGEKESLQTAEPPIIGGYDGCYVFTREQIWSGDELVAEGPDENVSQDRLFAPVDERIHAVDYVLSA